MSLLRRIGLCEGRDALRARNKQLKLRDGRSLGYAEYGDFRGKPIIFFHGALSSRLSAKILEKAATKLNTRVISVDRPGFGLSDFKPSRQILDWPDDVIELSDNLGFQRFSVLGLSSGGAYALACAFKIPERLIQVGVVGCEFPYNMPGFDHTMHRLVRWFNLLARRAPLILSLILWWAGIGVRMNLGRFISEFAAMFPKPDRAIFARPGAGQGFIENYLESHRYGTRGAILDMALVSSPWGFRLQDIPVVVHIWHGEADTAYPVVTAQHVADAIPRCLVKFYPDEGHFSLFFNFTEEILGVLVS